MKLRYACLGEALNPCASPPWGLFMRLTTPATHLATLNFKPRAVISKFTRGETTCPSRPGNEGNTKLAGVGFPFSNNEEKSTASRVQLQGAVAVEQRQGAQSLDSGVAPDVDTSVARQGIKDPTSRLALQHFGSAPADPGHSRARDCPSFPAGIVESKESLLLNPSLRPLIVFPFLHSPFIPNSFASFLSPEKRRQATRSVQTRQNIGAPTSPAQA